MVVMCFIMGKGSNSTKASVFWRFRRLGKCFPQVDIHSFIQLNIGNSVILGLCTKERRFKKEYFLKIKLGLVYP